MRKALAAFCLLLFLGATGWLVARATRAETLPIGADMPALRYRGSAGVRTLGPGNGRESTLVILFHSRCGHCHYELGLLDGNLERLRGTHLYLLTTEADLPQTRIRSTWPRLAASENVSWGTVKKTDFEREFGTLVTPAIFIFTPAGELIEKIRGEVKLAVILESITEANAGTPPRTS